MKNRKKENDGLDQPARPFAAQPVGLEKRALAFLKISNGILVHVIPTVCWQVVPL